MTTLKQLQESINQIVISFFSEKKLTESLYASLSPNQVKQLQSISNTIKKIHTKISNKKQITTSAFLRYTTQLKQAESTIKGILQGAAVEGKMLQLTQLKSAIIEANKTLSPLYKKIKEASDGLNKLQTLAECAQTRVDKIANTGQVLARFAEKKNIEQVLDVAALYLQHKTTIDILNSGEILRNISNSRLLQGLKTTNKSTTSSSEAIQVRVPRCLSVMQELQQKRKSPTLLVVEGDPLIAGGHALRMQNNPTSDEEQLCLHMPLMTFLMNASLDRSFGQINFLQYLYQNIVLLRAEGVYDLKNISDHTRLIHAVEALSVAWRDPALAEKIMSLKEYKNIVRDAPWKGYTLPPEGLTLTNVPFFNMTPHGLIKVTKYDIHVACFPLCSLDSFPPIRGYHEGGAQHPEFITETKQVLAGIEKASADHPQVICSALGQTAKIPSHLISALYKRFVNSRVNQQFVFVLKSGAPREFHERMTKPISDFPADLLYALICSDILDKLRGYISPYNQTTAIYCALEQAICDLTKDWQSTLQTKLNREQVAQLPGSFKLDSSTLCNLKQAYLFYQATTENAALIDLIIQETIQCHLTGNLECKGGSIINGIKLTSAGDLYIECNVVHGESIQFKLASVSKVTEFLQSAGVPDETIRYFYEIDIARQLNSKSSFSKHPYIIKDNKGKLHLITLNEVRKVSLSEDCHTIRFNIHKDITLNDAGLEEMLNQSAPLLQGDLFSTGAAIKPGNRIHAVKALTQKPSQNETLVLPQPASPGKTG